MSAPIAGPILPPSTPPAAPPAAASPPVENPEPTSDWRDRLTDADLPVLISVLTEHHARRRPLHREARDLHHRLTEGTSHP